MRLKSLILSIVLIFALSVPCFAMYTNELYDNIASEEIRNNLPDTSSLSNLNAFILLYNNKTNQYFYFRNYRTNYGGKFRINSSTDILTFDNGPGSFQFIGYYYDSLTSKWVSYSDSEGKSIFDEISVFDYSYIKVINTNLLVDDKTFDINENGKIEVDGVEQEPPISNDGTDSNEGTDLGGLTNSIKNFFSNLLDGIINFFKEFIDTLLGFVKFLIDLVVKLFKVVAKLPNLLTGFTELRTTLFSTLENIAFNNDIAKSIMAVALLSFSISIANLFLRLFAGSKLGGDS